MDETFHVLHIDPSAPDRHLVGQALAREPGMHVSGASSVRDADALLSRQVFDVVLTDLHTAEYEGSRIIDHVREVAPGVPVVVVTGSGSEAAAVEALKGGAADYVTKTPEHIDRLPRTIGSVIHDARHAAEKAAAERQLREQVARTRLILDTTLDGYILADADGRIRDVNSSYCRLIGYDREELVGTNIRQLEQKLSPEEVGRRIDQMMNRRHDRFETRHRAKDGRVVELEVSIAIVEDRGEALVAAFVRDVTQRKRSEEANRRLASAIEQAAESVVITDRDAVTQYVNPAFERITGYLKDEVIGQNPRILKSGHQSQAFYEHMWATLTSGDTWKGRMVNKRKDGQLYNEESVITPVRASSGAVANYVAVKRDITQELALEAQIRQAQKMESVGRLAGGVAHDFNNMLGVILGHTELALAKTPSENPLRESLLEIQKAAERSASLTRQLLGFARRQTIQPRVIETNTVVENALNMLGKLVGEDISLTFVPGERAWPITIDPSQMDQVLTNLCANARDAIRDTGTITIETGAVTFDDDYCRSHLGYLPGEYTMISVSDDGIGMDQETVDHIFEPFFTTKGLGTGLGMATVYGIVRQNGGFVNVYSEIGNGTSVKIYIPRSRTSERSAELSPVARSRQTGSETVLVVEDDPALRDVAQTILGELGYTVIAAGTPREAMIAVERHRGRIHLLISDVIMPEMNGRELAEHLSARIANLKCLFMSGYTADIIANRGVLAEGVQFIQKPFTSSDLASRVRETLDGD